MRYYKLCAFLRCLGNYPVCYIKREHDLAALHIIILDQKSRVVPAVLSWERIKRVKIAVNIAYVDYLRTLIHFVRKGSIMLCALRISCRFKGLTNLFKALWFTLAVLFSKRIILVEKAVKRLRLSKSTPVSRLLRNHNNIKFVAVLDCILSDYFKLILIELLSQ